MATDNENEQVRIGEIYCQSSVELKLDYKVDAIVTDPPYGINYDDWDKYENCVSFDKNAWKEISENLKPGGYLAIFGAARTFHRLVCAVEDAGLDVRDQLLWLYSMGMPKSSNIGKKLEDWKGWGTGLKPCYEPILLAQKPIIEKSIIENVKVHGVGAINIDASRLESGRWPGNVLHDGSDEVEQEFAKYGERGNGWSRNYGTEDYQGRQYKGGKFGGGGYFGETTYSDKGTASRFFYNVKASVKERTHDRTIENEHPTVKPVEVMKYIINMVTPKDGIVYDPFSGSGTTLVSCKELGFSYVGCEMEQKYVNIIKERLKATSPPNEFSNLFEEEPEIEKE
jgi:site-specific DNA-methyltransferase (adenine-specific)